MGTLAVANIVTCFILALAMLMPASMGGFNSITVGMYLALLTSIAGSFYLLAKRRELAPTKLGQLAGFIGPATLLALSPLLVALAFALLS